MINRLRFHLSTAIMWVGANVAPRELRPILINVLDAFAGIPAQVERGRTGGIIISGWSITLAGEDLSRSQQLAALQAAAVVRERHEAPAQDPSLDIPLVPSEGPCAYNPTTRLPETSWRAADPAPVETEAQLTHEFRLWCAENKLDWISADELLHEQGLTGAQRIYLVKFINRWNKALEGAE